MICQDEIKGPLIKQIDIAVDLIYTKYLKALISYDGLQRIETFMWPREAFREVLLNAIDNKLYQSGNPIQIKVYDDSISVFNEGNWPVTKLAVEDVYERHSSYPENPDLAGLFYASGEIEAWGSGFLKIKEECERAGAPLPDIEIGEGKTPDKGVIINCYASEKYKRLLRGEGKRTGSSQKFIGAVKEEISANENHKISAAERKSVERMLAILSDKLTDKEKKKIIPIAEYLKTHDAITTRKAAELTGRTVSTAQRYIGRLLELGVLETVGKSVSIIYKRK